jgi:hypothetical protein
VIHNELTDKYLSYFQDQDICMINSYDLSMPQQGGMDEDADAVYMCHDPILVNSKIDKPIVVDMDDKKSSAAVEYNLDNIIIYECNSRDNRIGEITNIATSILNQHTEDKKWQKINSDNVSLLRLYQGKEIDFVKTGYRWIISKNLRKYLKRLPYFLLFNYPKKLDVYNSIRKINKGNNNDDKIPYNAYKSPSPLNELCDYICQWEKHNIKWDRSVVNNSNLLINNDYDLLNNHIIKKIKVIYNGFKIELQQYIQQNKDIDVLIDEYKKELMRISLDFEYLANYCIKVAYRSISEDKVLCWSIFGDIILKNLRQNSQNKGHYKIVETTKDDKEVKEFLGKYYKLEEVDVFKSNT